MADNVTVDNATNGDYVVSSDDAGASGQVQRVKLTYSADGDATHIAADADGLLVNLGANNDITVTGTVPVTGTIVATDGGSSLTVDGTVAVSSLTGTVPVSQTGAPWTVGGTVQVSGVSGTVPVTGTIAGSGNFTVVQSTATNLKVDASGVAVPVTDNSGSLTVDNGGTFAVQESGSALTALQKIDDPVLVDDAAFTPATSSVMMSGFEADESSTDSLDEGDAGAARMTLDRKQIVTVQPHSAGGCSIFRSLDIDETEEDVKTSAGTLYGWAVTNTATSTRFIKFYNATAANVTVGTTTPVITWGIPGNSSDDVSANMMGGVGINFDTAICVAATTGVADNDTGAPGANDVIINVFYK